MSITLPRTWKLCKDEKINKIYDEVYEEARSLGLLSKHHHKRPLYINKSVRFWGYAGGVKNRLMYMTVRYVLMRKSYRQNRMTQLEKFWFMKLHILLLQVNIIVTLGIMLVIA